MASSLMQASERLVAVDAFVQTVRQNDWDRADQLRSELGAMLGEECLAALTMLHLHRERWADAVETIDLLKHPTHDQLLQRTLARNLDSLRTHRPAVYRAVADAEIGSAYQIQPSKSGRPTILAIRDDESRILLSGGADPQTAAEQVCTSLKTAFDKGTAIALLSIGDGYVLDAIARNSPTLLLGRRQAIFFFEPDPRLVFACMLLHDFTGPAGPIESKNVLWYVGDNWENQFRLDILTDRYLPFPQTTIKLGHNTQPLEAVLQTALGQLGEMDQRASTQIRSHYSHLTGADFACAIDGNAGRRPRVLLLTTRFSTVLQHSTRDAAEAFQHLGWDAHVQIEPTTHHMVCHATIRQTIAEFKPDLIFQIDHHRFAHTSVIPSNVPFVNWIQDLLPHLMKQDTGKQLGLRDFVLTPSKQQWVDDYAYPARQCLEFRKLTHIPLRPTGWSSRAEQVIYVSNWSQTPEAIRDELTRNLVGVAYDVADRACEAMIEAYEAGGTLATQGDVRRTLVDVLRSLQLTTDEATIRQTTARLFDRMNNLLFRQQGLRWATQACAALGLELEIYGNGWDNNPEFSKFARGKIEYGQSLEELTRQSGINLVLEPFVCVAHQRLLDALVAGGFCLIRSTPANSILQSLVDIISHAGPGLESASDIDSAWRGSPQHQTLLDTLSACRTIDACNGADPIIATRRLIDSGFLPATGELLPMLRQTSFESPQQLESMLARYARDNERRSDISRQQRRVVENRYSYQNGLKHVIRFVSDRLMQEADSERKAA